MNIFILILSLMAFASCELEDLEPRPPLPIESAQLGEPCDHKITCDARLSCVQGICVEPTTSVPEITDAGGSNHGNGTVTTDAGGSIDGNGTIDAGGSADGHGDGTMLTDAGSEQDAGGHGDDTLCLIDEYVSSHVCTPCPAGTSNMAGDDASGNDTFCSPILCGVNEFVANHICTPCPAGSTNARFDDASGADTICDATLCDEDHYVSNHVCTPCAFGATNAANDDASGVDTLCDLPSDCAGLSGGSYLLYCDGTCAPPSSTVASCGKTWSSPTCGTITTIPTITQAGIDHHTLGKINILRERFHNYLSTLYGAPFETSKDNAIAAFDTFNIVSDANGPYQGGEISDDDIVQVLLPLARWAFHQSDHDVAQKAVTGVRWLLRSTATGADGTSTCDDFGLTGAFYDLDQMHHVILLLHSFYTPQEKEEILAALSRELEFDETLWPSQAEPGYSTDYIYLQLHGLLGAALYLTSNDAETAFLLNQIKPFLERFLSVSPALKDGFKADTLGFHNWVHHNSYLYAINTLASQLHILRDTDWNINADSYELLSDVIYGMLLLGNDTDFSNGFCGRHPFDSALKVSQTAFRQTIETSTSAQGHLDTQLASAYERVWNAGDFDVPQEEFPQGFWQFNSGGFGIYRNNNWVATLKGFTSDFWGAEIFITQNRYGRYQSYGTLEIMYPGGRASNGISMHGWDWNKVPGTTTIHVSYESLRAKMQRQDEVQLSDFVGAVRFHPRPNGLRNIEGEGGFFAMEFEQDPISSCRDPNDFEDGEIPKYRKNPCLADEGHVSDHAVGFTFKKSVFAIDGKMISLGSAISNSDETFNTATNLFQITAPQNPGSFILNGITVAGMSHNAVADLSQAQWLIDNAAGADGGTGYYIPRCTGGTNVCPELHTLRDPNQRAPLENASGIDDGSSWGGGSDRASWSEGDMLSAWLDHGTQPDDATYEYVVIPGATPDDMIAFADAQADNLESLYKIHKQDEEAHIIEHTPTGLTGYALFAANTPTPVGSGPISHSSVPIIATAQQEGDSSLTLHVVNPDFGIVFRQTEPASTHPIDVFIRGEWYIGSNTADISVTHWTPDGLVLRLATSQGLPMDIHLLGRGACADTNAPCGNCEGIADGPTNTCGYDCADLADAYRTTDICGVCGGQETNNGQCVECTSADCVPPFTFGKGFSGIFRNSNAGCASVGYVGTCSNSSENTCLFLYPANAACNGFGAVEKFQIDMVTSERTDNFQTQGGPFLGVADVNQDGRDDLVYPGSCGTDGHHCWRVHYSQGLFFSIGHDFGDGFYLSDDSYQTGILTGNFHGDSQPDFVYSGWCGSYGQACWRLHRGQDTLDKVIGSTEPTAFSTQSYELGLTVGDFNSDGQDDILYRGTCGVSETPCWRVHLNAEIDNGKFDTGQDWGGDYSPDGDAALFGLHAGDFNGDNTADILYRGDCNGDPCWRVHLGSSNGLGAGQNWGNGYYGSELTPLMGLQIDDFNGDGNDDLVYRGRCGNPGVHCWRMHLSNGAGFNNPTGW
ncbi:MAG: hypothetical protein CMH56_17465 [Myxococcales bacterium]|nr:hypothetical protein [Myxococcales bacterium]